MRYRQRADDDIIVYNDWQEYLNGAPTSSKGHDGVLQYRQVEEMWDVITPQYHKRVDNGEIINNPLVVKSSSVVEPVVPGVTIYDVNNVNHFIVYKAGCWTESRLKNTGKPMSVAYTAALNKYASDVQLAIDTAKLNCVANIDSTPYSLLEDVAEFRSTAKTLRAPLHSANVAADRFYRRVRNLNGKYLKRGNLSRSEAAAQAVSTAWLSARYEFRPIMIALGQAWEGFPKVRARSKRMKARGTGSAALGFSETISTSGVTYTHRNAKNYKVRAYVYYTMANSRDYADWDYGVRLKDVPATAWALVPASYVFDKFVNISNALKGLEALMDPRLTVLTGGVTVSELSVDEWRATSPISYPWTGSPLNGGPRVFSDKVVSRQLWSPSYADIVPPLSIDRGMSDLSNVGDMAALCSKKLGRALYLAGSLYALPQSTSS